MKKKSLLYQNRYYVLEQVLELIQLEAKYAQSDKDLHKLSVSLKESAETKYWLELLKDDYLSDKEANTLLNDNEEIIKILISTTKKLKN